MIVTEKKHREALALIASLEGKLSKLDERLRFLQSQHEQLARAAGYVFLPRWSSSEYAHKDSERAKQYMAELEKQWSRK